MTGAETDWQRLDPRMLAVTPIRQLAGFLPVIAVVLVVGVGQDVSGRIYGLLGVLAVVLVGVLRWATTRYRITSERVELRSGLLFRNARSVPRDRIRSVDITAGPVHRLFGLSVVKIGTGERTEGDGSRELSLDAVSTAEADRMRQRLLVSLGAGDDADHSSVTVPSTATELAALNWAWLRFAPLTVSSLVAVGAVAGAFGQLAGELGADITNVGGIREKLSIAPLWLGVSAFAVLVLAIALVGSVLIFVEAWWGFRLVREVGGTLRIRRGLLTTRSVSLEERRVRGVEVIEPLLLRIGGGARTIAVATGLGGGQGNLLPPAPVGEAHRLSGAVLTEEPSPTRASLRRHPPEALRRRLVRAVLPVVTVSAVAWLAPVPAWVAWATLGLLPVTVLLALDAYRNLGHALTSRYLVTRHGAGVRDTVALQRSGVIGWTVSQSFFQRRAGLVTVTASTAAGRGAYRVIDVRAADGLAVADQAVPGLLRPFLHHDVAVPSAH